MSRIQRLRARLLISIPSILIIGVIAYAGVTLQKQSSADELSSIGNYTIPDHAAYPIPAGSLYVSNSGSDTNNGTSLATPFKTLGRAITAASDGGTIVIRGGVYREGNFKFFKKLTIQAYANEQVWLKGSAEIPENDWVVEGTNWRKDNWAPTSPLCLPTAADAVNPGGGAGGNGCANWYFADEPLLAATQWPDQTFVNGTDLKQVLSLAELSQAGNANSFYVDRAAQKLYVNVNPAGKVVESTDKKYAFVLYGECSHGTCANDHASGTTIKGIGMLHYGSSQNYSREDSATILSQAHDFTLQDSVIAKGASAGVTLKSSGLRILNSLIVDNSFNGLIANQVDNALIDGNTISNNQLGMWYDVSNFGSAAAGAKITYSDDVTISNNIFDSNKGNGFWCDLQCNGFTITGNVISNNRNKGIFYEVSNDAIIASNVIYDNGNEGITVISQNVKVYNNTLSNNLEGIAVLDDPRITGTTDNADTTAVYAIAQNVEVKNNIIAGTNGTGSSTLYGRPLKLIDIDGLGNPQSLTPDLIVTQLDNNFYYRDDGLPAAVLGWAGGRNASGQRTVNRTFTTVASISATGGINREQNGIGLDTPTNPLFVDAANDDYSLTQASPARNQGAALPADVASAIGVPSGAVVSMGALQVRGQNMVPAPAGDTTAPSVSITNPSANASLKGTVTVAGTATDTVGVTSVQLLINNQLVATDNSAPYSFSYNFAQLVNGTHNISLRAFDAANNASTATISVIVANKPGDANGDNAVDIFDASVLAANYGRTGVTRAQGDMNNDGSVNIFDASIMASNWGL